MKKTFKITISFTLAFMLFFTSISFNKNNTTAPGKNVTISLLGDHAEAKRIKFPINNKKPSKPQKPSTPKPPKKGFKNGDEGEKFLNKLVKGNGHKTYKTTKNLGKRVVDVYIKKKRTLFTNLKLDMPQKQNLSKNKLIKMLG